VVESCVQGITSYRRKPKVFRVVIEEKRRRREERAKRG